MRVLDVIEHLRANGVAPTYANSLLNAQAIYDRLFDKAWPLLHDMFYFQIEAPLTPVETFTGIVGDNWVTASAALVPTIDQFLGREFTNDDTPLAVIGADYTSDTLSLAHPLTAEVAAGTALSFFRRSYLPTNSVGDRLSKVRSQPTWASRTRFGAPVPDRMVPSAINRMGLTTSVGASLFSYVNAPFVKAPVLAPVVSRNVAAGGTPASIGDYRAYVANKIGPYYSELSLPSAVFTYAGVVAGDIGVVTTVDQGPEEKVFLVEGPLEVVTGMAGLHSKTGLRIVSEGSALVGNFELDEAWLFRRPLYRPTYGSISVQYGGQPDAGKSAACTGWPLKRTIHSWYDELQFDTRFLHVWRELAKHIETGDGKHFMSARSAMASLLAGTVNRL